MLSSKRSKMITMAAVAAIVIADGSIASALTGAATYSPARTSRSSAPTTSRRGQATADQNSVNRAAGERRRASCQPITLLTTAVTTGGAFVGTFQFRRHAAMS